MAANPDFLHRRRYTGHPTDIIQLQGSRLVVVSELAAGEGLDESRTKLLTGSDVLRGRGIAKDFTQFEPTFTIILQTNHLPVVTSQDEGMWRRLQVIPWTQQWVLPGREGLLPGRPVADPTLEDQLKEELRGILGWCVRGAQQWFERGLDFPKTVREATLAYRKEQDQLAAFALACLVPEEGARSNVSAVYDAYCRFQKQQGQAALSQTAFGTAMAKRYKRQHFANANYYMNVRLVEPPQKDDEKTGA
jgi:putative DNA primase/helicase